MTNKIQDYEEIFQLLRSGKYTLGEIGEQFGVSKERIRQIGQKAGIPNKKKKMEEKLKEIRDNIESLWKTDLSVREISEKYDCPERIIRNVIHEKNLPTRNEVVVKNKYARNKQIGLRIQLGLTISEVSHDDMAQYMNEPSCIVTYLCKGMRNPKNFIAKISEKTNTPVSYYLMGNPKPYWSSGSDEEDYQHIIKEFPKRLFKAIENNNFSKSEFCQLTNTPAVVITSLSLGRYIPLHQLDIFAKTLNCSKKHLLGIEDKFIKRDCHG